MSRPSLVPLDASAYSETEAVIFAQTLAAVERADDLREEVAAHCDDAIRLGLLHAFLVADQSGQQRLNGRVARRREAILALDHAELHFAIRGRHAEEIGERQRADALRHAAKSCQAQLKQEIEDLTRRHEEETQLRDTLGGMTRRLASG